MKKLQEMVENNLWLALIAAASFTAAVPVGLLIYPLVSDRLPSLLQDAFGGIMGGPDWLVIFNVFARNTTASIVMMLLGVTIVLPLAALFANGLLVGLVFRFASDRGLDPVKIAIGIIPHGILELPAIFLSAALGMRVGLQLATQRGRRLAAGWDAAKEAAAVYLSLVSPLLLIAAAVEILVSKNLIG
ncbi:MAG: stage II sporulation protein M [Candidatus Altiarchaeota archaeon]